MKTGWENWVAQPRETRDQGRPHWGFLAVKEGLRNCKQNHYFLHGQIVSGQGGMASNWKRAALGKMLGEITQAAQRSSGHLILIPGSIWGQLGWGFQHPSRRYPCPQQRLELNVFKVPFNNFNVFSDFMTTQILKKKKTKTKTPKITFLVRINIFFQISVISLCDPMYVFIIHWISYVTQVYTCTHLPKVRLNYYAAYCYSGFLLLLSTILSLHTTSKLPEPSLIYLKTSLQ